MTVLSLGCALGCPQATALFSYALGWLFSVPSGCLPATGTKLPRFFVALQMPTFLVLLRLPTSNRRINPAFLLRFRLTF